MYFTKHQLKIISHLIDADWFGYWAIFNFIFYALIFFCITTDWLKRFQASGRGTSGIPGSDHPVQ